LTLDIPEKAAGGRSCRSQLAGDGVSVDIDVADTP